MCTLIKGRCQVSRMYLGFFKSFLFDFVISRGFYLRAPSVHSVVSLLPLRTSFSVHYLSSKRLSSFTTFTFGCRTSCDTFPSLSVCIGTSFFALASSITFFICVPSPCPETWDLERTEIGSGNLLL